MRDHVLGSVGWIARSMTARVVLGGSIVLAALAVLYSIVVPLVPKGPAKPAPQAAVAAPTPVNALPRIQGTAPLTFRWDGIDGLQAVEMPGERLYPGQPVLKLTGGRGGGRHRIGLAVLGLEPARAVRVTASVRPAAGTRLGLVLRDGKFAHQGVAILDMGSRASSASGDITRPSLDVDASGWVKISAVLQTEDGVIVVYIGLLDSVNRDSFKPTEPMEFTLGGIEAVPQ